MVLVFCSPNWLVERWFGGEVRWCLELSDAYARVVKSHDIAVAIFEGRDQAFKVGHVVGQLRDSVSWASL